MALTGRSRLQPAMIVTLALLTLAAFAVGLVCLVTLGSAAAIQARQNDRTLENRRLAWALWQRDKDAVAAALKAGADSNARFPAWQYEDFQGDDPPGPTPKAAFPKYDSFWCSSIPVIMCVQNSYYVPMLKDAGADVNARDSDGDTPLLFMARGGLASLRWGDFSYQSDMIKGLLQAGADVHARDKDGNTVLHVLDFSFAAGEKSDLDDLEDALKLLVRYGADVGAKNDAGQTVMQALEAHFVDGQRPADKRRILAVLKRALTSPVGSHAANADGLQRSAVPPQDAPPPIIGPDDGQDHRSIENWMLAWAIRHDNVDAAQAALKAGADPNAGFTSRQYVRVQQDNPPRPTPDEGDARSERLPFLFASGADTAKALVDAGADINARNAEGETPLLFIAADGELAFAPDDMGDHTGCDVEMIAALLKAGANIKDRDPKGNTALHLIPQCFNRSGEAYDNTDDVAAGIRLLVRHGADVNARNNAGKTVLQVTDDTAGSVDGNGRPTKIFSTLTQFGARGGQTVHRARKRH